MQESKNLIPVLMFPKKLSVPTDYGRFLVEKKISWGTSIGGIGSLNDLVHEHKLGEVVEFFDHKPSEWSVRVLEDGRVDNGTWEGCYHVYPSHIFLNAVELDLTLLLPEQKSQGDILKLFSIDTLMEKLMNEKYGKNLTGREHGFDGYIFFWNSEISDSHIK